MKKQILIGMLSVGSVASALAQGSVVFENAVATGSITLGPNTGASSYAPANSYTVALLWASGTTLVSQSALTQIALYGAATGQTTPAGFFYDPTAIYTGVATVGGTAAVFEVEAWIGNYTSYSAAVAAHAAVGQSGEFLNLTGDPTSLHGPPTPPVQTTGWDGNLILVPEPGTVVIGGLGIAALLFFRRRK